MLTHNPSGIYEHVRASAYPDAEKVYTIKHQLRSKHQRVSILFLFCLKPY